MGEDDSFTVHLECVRAIQESLYMYKTLLNYKHFVVDLDVELGCFCVDKYIDCSFSFDILDEDDQVFLREASAVKLICQLQDTISINEGIVETTDTIKLARSLVKNQRLNHVGILKTVIEELLNVGRIKQDLHIKAFDKFVVCNLKAYLCL